MGEAHLDEEEREFFRNNEDSKIVFLEDREKVFIEILFSCPMEQGLNGVTGLKYEALKDFISWNYDDDYALEDVTKKHLPFLLSLGKSLASEINENNRTN